MICGRVVSILDWRRKGRSFNSLVMPGFAQLLQNLFCPRPGLGPAVPWRVGGPARPAPRALDLPAPPGPGGPPAGLGSPLQYTGPLIFAPFAFNFCSTVVPSMSRRCSVDVPSMSHCSADPPPPLCAVGHLPLAMLCDALSDTIGLARIRLQSIVASLRRKTSILFRIKQNDIGAPSFGGVVLLTVLWTWR